MICLKYISGLTPLPICSLQREGYGEIRREVRRHDDLLHMPGDFVLEIYFTRVAAALSRIIISTFRAVSGGHGVRRVRKCVVRLPCTDAAERNFSARCGSAVRLGELKEMESPCSPLHSSGWRWTGVCGVWMVHG